MQVFERELISTHCVGAQWPEFLGKAAIGESFVVETVECDANGPIEISGVGAGDDIAVHIEKINIEGPFTAPNGGPFFEGMGEAVPLEYRDGYFFWPDNFRLKTELSVGNVAILPEPTDEIMEISRTLHFGPVKGKPNPRGWRTVVRDTRGKHCHQDCRALGEGSIIHLKAQVDGAGLCLEDVHGYIGEGELSFGGIECNARVQVRIERSEGWLIDWPIIETENEIMVFSSYTSTYIRRPQMKYVDIVREAYRALREVVATKIGGTIDDANTIVATAADIRNCALYGLGEGYIPPHKDIPPFDIAIVAVLPKNVFIR
ncbi:MAG: acetamidase/formamidase family protein [Planctomycetota bacterium]